MILMRFPASRWPTRSPPAFKSVQQLSPFILPWTHKSSGGLEAGRQPGSVIIIIIKLPN
jgi:hypothetical protein